MAEIKRIEKRGNVLIIDGEYWQFTGRHEGTEMVFQKINKKKFNALVELLVKKLSPSVDTKIILTDALGELPIANLEKIVKTLHKKKVKPRTREGCVELAIGGHVINLRG